MCVCDWWINNRFVHQFTEDKKTRARVCVRLFEFQRLQEFFDLFEIQFEMFRVKNYVTFFEICWLL